MIDVLITLGLAVAGVLALRYVRDTRRALAEADRQPRTLSTAGHGDVVDITATVADGPVLTSPLQGLPSVFWHVRAITISSLRRTELARTEAERTSADTFELESDGVRLRLAGPSCRFGTGLIKVHGDQGSFTKDLFVEGERIPLRPIAHGVRHVLEGTLRPGDHVWLNGRLDTQQTPWRLVAVDDERGVTVDTMARDARLRRITSTVAATGVLGVVLLAVAAVRIL